MSHPKLKMTYKSSENLDEPLLYKSHTLPAEKPLWNSFEFQSSLLWATFIPSENYHVIWVNTSWNLQATLTLVQTWNCMITNCPNLTTNTRNSSFSYSNIWMNLLDSILSILLSEFLFGKLSSSMSPLSSGRGRSYTLV